MIVQYTEKNGDARKALTERMLQGDMTVSNKEVAAAYEIDPYFDVKDIPLDSIDPSHPALRFDRSDVFGGRNELRTLHNFARQTLTNSRDGHYDFTKKRPVIHRRHGLRLRAAVHARTSECVDGPRECVRRID